ncbi:MAG TPA: hypothetical protein VGH54_23950 [Mycobacterium sp.]|jgi:hypothetical protein|uniref:hypothetical protein n=1 Tax=Mycobacterium sp. TaxID=1785 RepID=UPI002F407CEB
MRRFVLRRSHDVTGVSGCGDVAEGVQFTDGTCVIRWVVGEHRSTVVWPDVASAEAVHSHGGNTVVAWIDPDPNSVDVAMFGGTVRRLPAA